MTTPPNPSCIKSTLDEVEKQIQSGYNYQETLDQLKPLIAALRNSGLTDRLALSLQYCGICHFELGQLSNARACFEEGLSLARADMQTSLISQFLHELSQIALREGKIAESQKLCSESLSLCLKKDGDVSHILMQMAILYQLQRRFREAESLLKVVRSNCERNFDVYMLARILHEIGLIEFELGNYSDGVRSFIDSVRYKRILGDSQGVLKSFQILQACFLQFPSALADQEVIRMIDSEL